MKSMIYKSGIAFLAVASIGLQAAAVEHFLPGVLDKTLDGEAPRTFSGLVFDMNQSGQAIAAWKVTTTDTGNSRGAGIYGAYFDGTQWQQSPSAIEGVIGEKVPGTTIDSELPWVSINDNIDANGTVGTPVAMIAWQDGGTFLRGASLVLPGMSGQKWEEFNIETGTTFAANSRMRLKVGPIGSSANGTDVRAVVLWQNGSNEVQSRYSDGNSSFEFPASTWQNATGFAGSTIQLEAFENKLDYGLFGNQVAFVFYGALPPALVEFYTLQEQAWVSSSARRGSSARASLLSHTNKTINSFTSGGGSTNGSIGLTGSVVLSDLIALLNSGAIQNRVIGLASINDGAADRNNIIASAIGDSSNLLLYNGEQSLTTDGFIPSQSFLTGQNTDFPSMCVNGNGRGVHAFYTEESSIGNLNINYFSPITKGTTSGGVFSNIFTYPNLNFVQLKSSVTTQAVNGSEVPFRLVCAESVPMGDGSESLNAAGLAWLNKVAGSSDVEEVRVLMTNANSGPISPPGPTNLKVDRGLVRYPLQAEVSDILSWDVSIFPASSTLVRVVKQQIYQNSVLIADNILPSQSTYQFNNVSVDQATYEVVAIVEVNAFGGMHEVPSSSTAAIAPAIDVSKLT